MVEKLYEYEGFLGRLHYVRDSMREKWHLWKEQHPDGLLAGVKQHFLGYFENKPEVEDYDKTEYAHLYRRKTRRELIRISAAVMGIEFSYAAETAFVSPTLLKIGVEHKHMTLVWALSPLVGFFLTPVLGSISDRCQLKLGRRRPFIILMAIGVLLGLLLVPNGEYFGYLAGDIAPVNNVSTQTILSHRTTALESGRNNTINDDADDDELKLGYHPWGIFFTILGTVLLDFDADACQSPSRAYLLDVTIPEDHARGLSTFTIMAGLGGFFGYATGGINWDITKIGELLGGHVRAVFTLITIIFIICVTYTVTSFKEIPLRLLEIVGNTCDNSNEECTRIITSTDVTYGALAEKEDKASPDEDEIEKVTVREYQQRLSMAPPPNASLILYLKSIIFMPFSLRILCLTNLFCWMAHVCYSLYFTDFVGEAVFNGDPAGLEGSESRQLYEEGIRFGCWGMSMYSLSCACYSFVIEKLIKRFGAKYVYVGGLLVYSTGMLLMAVTKHKVGVIVFSWTAGIMYSTLFTMPYLLVAHYHANKTFEPTDDTCDTNAIEKQVRGLGTDVAIVSSMVFLAQFILSMVIGSIVTSTGTTTAVVSSASLLAFFGAISATQVMYLDL